MSNVNRWAMVQNGIVINIVNWDGDVNKWSPPENTQMVIASEDTGIGWSYQDGEFVRPVEPSPPE